MSVVRSISKIIISALWGERSGYKRWSGLFKSWQWVIWENLEQPRSPFKIHQNRM